jgi:hypothetical protein
MAGVIGLTGRSVKLPGFFFAFAQGAVPLAARSAVVKSSARVSDFFILISLNFLTTVKKMNIFYKYLDEPFW